MPVKRFHPRMLAKLSAPTSGQIDFWDVEQPGLSLRVGAGGRRAWVVIYRANGIKRRFTIGRFPDVSLAQARRKARELRASAQLGMDPAKEKYRIRKATSFGGLVKRYIDHLQKMGQKKTWETDARVLQNDVLPRFRTYKAEEVTPREISRLLEELDQRSPTAARRALETIRQLYNYGRKIHEVVDNPAAQLEAPTPKGRRERYLSMEEIAMVLTEVAKESFQVASAVLLLLLTLCRENEILSMEKPNVSPTGGYIGLENTKNKRGHVVPITPLISAIVEKLVELNQNGVYLFPSRRKPGSHISQEMLRRRVQNIVEGLGLDKTWVHDLRRSGATHLGRLGVSKQVIAKLLNHTDSSVTARYNLFDYFPQREEALRQWEAELRRVPEIRIAIEIILAKA